MQTAVTSFNELSASIKEKEKRLAEIQVLKTHIINYVKTKDVYADYRKCGYSKKFLEEHRQEILLHKAAKNAFDELGVKKLPKVKELNAEYAEILAEKKKLYGEYRQAKKDMQEFQRAKYDIDQFLKRGRRAEEGTCQKTSKYHSIILFGESTVFISCRFPSFFISEDISKDEVSDSEELRSQPIGCSRGLGMCLQRAKVAFLYKKALLATLRRRALTPSKMVPRERNKIIEKSAMKSVFRDRCFDKVVYVRDSNNCFYGNN